MCFSVQSVRLVAATASHLTPDMSSAASSVDSRTRECDARAANRATAAIDVLDVLGCSRIIRWKAADVRFAVLVKVLSGRSDLALHSIRLKQLQQHRWRPGLALNPTEDHLREWCAAAASSPDVAMCLANVMAPLRQEVQLFLVESYVAEAVHRLNRSGLLVPSSRVLQLFLRCLHHVPLSAKSSQLVRSLARAQFAKRWSRRFRQRWGLEWGGDVVPHSVTQCEIRQRAGIFLRWLRHVLSERAGGKPVVVVNMDETFLSNIKPWKKGIVCRRASGAEGHAGNIRKDAPLSRTTLIASVCSHAALQRVLPQIRLPRGKPGKFPSAPTGRAYALAGAPQVALHGSSGWNTAMTMKCYVRLLSASLKRGAPGHVVVLVMDCCPSHLSADVLAAARRAGVHVVIIPARLTWLMQPLDTHVFALLKRIIRTAEYDWKAGRDERRMGEADRIELHGAAIRQVLVEGDWSRTMARAGLLQGAALLRQELANAVAGDDLRPRAPTVHELAALLNESEQRATSLMRLLLPSLPVPRTTSSGPSAAAGAAAAAGASAAGESRVSPRPVVILSLRRLPARPPLPAAGQNIWLPAPPRRVQTRSMTTAASAAASSHASPSAGGPPSKKPRE